MNIKLRKIVLFAIAFMLILSSCKRSQLDRAMIISKLRNSAKLATVEYIVTKVISAKDKNWFAKDAYFFAETEATIKAGIDLDKLKEEDIKIEGSKISILLPPIEILNFSYPAEGFTVINKYSDDSAIFKWNSIDVSLKDDLYRQGEASIRESLEDLGIIKTAQKNTRILLTKILNLSGFEEIYIDFKESKELKTQDENLLNEFQEFLDNKKK
ncbi:MAG: DUF4230 domain-containing protein [Bacteroidales bacterium]|nr:DUF4230 domain-containing protein [Bacteroidales bacterium]MBN2758337.1 DUF4230 domain-containing protein [Bacteroidales bacterium]